MANPHQKEIETFLRSFDQYDFDQPLVRQFFNSLLLFIVNNLINDLHNYDTISQENLGGDYVQPLIIAYLSMFVTETDFSNWIEIQNKLNISNEFLLSYWDLGFQYIFNIMKPSLHQIFIELSEDTFNFDDQEKILRISNILNNFIDNYHYIYPNNPEMVVDLVARVLQFQNIGRDTDLHSKLEKLKEKNTDTDSKIRIDLFIRAYGKSKEDQQCVNQTEEKESLNSLCINLINQICLIKSLIFKLKSRSGLFSSSYNNNMQEHIDAHMEALVKAYVSLLSDLKLSDLQKLRDPNLIVDRRESLTRVIYEVRQQITSYQQTIPKERRAKFDDFLEKNDLDEHLHYKHQDNNVECYISDCCETYKYEEIVSGCERELQIKLASLPETKLNKKERAKATIAHCDKIRENLQKFRSEALGTTCESETLELISNTKVANQKEIDAISHGKYSDIRERLTDGLKSLFEKITGYRCVLSTNKTIDTVSRRFAACA